MSRERAAVFGRKADAPIDLGNLLSRPVAPKPPIDAAEVEAVAARHGFTPRDGGAIEGGGEGASAAPPPPIADQAPSRSASTGESSSPSGRRAPRSGRTIPINLKATPDHQQRFFALCDRLTEIQGRPITQAEGFEMAIAALEREVSKGEG